VSLARPIDIDAPPPRLDAAAGKSAADASRPTIALESVGKAYRSVQAVGEVTLRVEPGECLALLGHNGAGKTTIMKMLLGLTRPTTGTVRVFGEDPAAAASVALRRHIGFLPENVMFHDALSGRETMALYARLKHADPRRNADLLERVGLGAAARRPVRTYSKGMRQRLGLAQALLGQPRLMLLDEPTTGLDPVSRQSFYAVIEELRAGGTTILLSSHALTEIEGHADRAAIMSLGRLVAHGSLPELRRAAGLPVRMRVTLAAGDGAFLQDLALPLQEVRRIAPGCLELACSSENRIAVLRAAVHHPEVVDIEVHQPTLVDVYAHYNKVEGER
jgi:Cu-processing system ATP-binding protein